MATILCIDDEPSVGVVLEHHLQQADHEPLLATSVAEALQALKSQTFDLILCDDHMPGGDGFDLLERLREEGIETPVIMLTGSSSVERAVASMRRGAVDCLHKPLRPEALRAAVASALECARLRRDQDLVRREIHALRGARTIVGDSPAMAAVLDTLDAVAPTRATVLLEGESGTGKELFARAIHGRSPRREQAFVTVNCAALPEGLVESMLFGHERGAFTGASQRQLGAFERAHRGTLLLDEISEMRLDLQAKLLRAIQEQEIERVGGSQSIPVDVRIVATTNRDLAAEVAAGRFRQDLYYRLAVMPVRTPALRERPGDIRLLVDHYVRLFAGQLGIRPPLVPARTLEALERRTWPGNVRELANAVERAIILARGGALVPELFASPSAEVRTGVRVGPGDRAAKPLDPALASALGEGTLDLCTLERIAIERALAATGGMRARAAHLLGISERTLRNKLNGPVAQAA